MNFCKKGVQVKKNKIANNRGAICNKHGNNVNEAVIQDTKTCKDNAFNLFSIVRFLKEGWSFGGKEKQACLLEKEIRR